MVPKSGVGGAKKMCEQRVGVVRVMRVQQCAHVHPDVWVELSEQGGAQEASGGVQGGGGQGGGSQGGGESTFSAGSTLTVPAQLFGAGTPLSNKVRSKKRACSGEMTYAEC